MRLVHLSDLHLGFRQYQRLTPTGINQREADVAGTFRRAMDRTIALDPDVVLVAGDVFHNVRPTNPAILDAFTQFSRLRATLPNAAIVMIAGNHDTPRTAETGGILRLFRNLGIEVVDTETRQVTVPDLDLSVLAVPDADSVRLARFEPEPEARWNVLLLHGVVEGMLPDFVPLDERRLREIPRERLSVERWDYVALGDYHVYREIAPNAFYAGSIDYTSANPWGELSEARLAGIDGKGIIERDLATGAHAFHPIDASRALIDLPSIRAAGLGVAELDRAIAETVEGQRGGIDDAIVRLVVYDVARHVARDLDHKAIREYKRRALHFHLDLRRPSVARRDAASGAPGRRATLAEIVRDKLESRAVPTDVDRDALVGLGLHYLSEAERRELAQSAAGAASPIPTADGDGADSAPSGEPW